ncbi:MAG TPA: hypothetical protein VFJ74_00890 [Gemmatimonadaceae bacterium]|nr:hypothetical protein [Gemmatimonadaceae bacterium]
MTSHASAIASAAWRIAAAAVLWAGCGFSRSQRAEDSAAARTLVGTWDGRFQRAPETPARAGRVRSPPAPTVHGVFAFVANDRVDGTEELPDPTNVGTYDAEFEPLGFEPGDPGRVPVALARAWGHDSVVVLLGPGGDRPGMRLHGAWMGQSLVGTWSLVDTRMLGASGTFVLTRHRDEREWSR